VTSQTERQDNAIIGGGFAILVVLIVLSIVGIPGIIVGGLLYRPMRKEFGRAGAVISVFIGLAIFVGCMVAIIISQNHCQASMTC